MKFAQSQLVTYESPQFQKLQGLCDKWSQIKGGLEKGKFEKKEIVENSIHKIDSLLNYDGLRDQESFKNLKDQISKLNDIVNSEKGEKELWKHRQTEQLQTFEENISRAFDEERTSKKRVELQLLKQIEERFDNLNRLLEKNNGTYYDKLNLQISDINNQVGQLKYTLENETQSRYLRLLFRADSQANLIEQMDVELNKFQEILFIERQVRDETDKKIYSMINDVHQKIQKEIQLEKIEKQASHDHILRLLECTCLKIDESFNNSK